MLICDGQIRVGGLPSFARKLALGEEPLFVGWSEAEFCHHPW